MNTEILKEIIVENEKFILNSVKDVIPRLGLNLPAISSKVCMFYGVRRSGKSFLLFDLFRKYKDFALYLDFEDERLTGFTVNDFSKIKDTFLELKPHLINRKGLIFLLDEIQNIEGWEKYARRMVEKEDVKVFCAGSSSKITPQGIHTSLRGRSWSVEVLPFSFREFIQTKNLQPDQKDIFYGTNKTLLKKYFQEYLRYGGFPEIIFLETEFEKKKILGEYMEAMFFKDLVERFEIKNIHLLDALREKIFSSFSTKCSLTSFYKQFQGKFPFSKDSLFLYYKYFLESMLIFEARKFSESSYKRLRNPAKVYLADLGLSKKITSSDFGRLLENIVFLQLHRKDYEIFYFEENNECDFVVKKDEEWSVYQVTWQLNEGNREREIKGLLNAAKFFKLKEGTIITNDEESEQEYQGINIRVVPIWKWLILS
ncbi:MAG: ATP-binding protein [Elusimicrobiota bacterium]